jgi:BlaI family transcriptional regulator, penicillinase repressor
VTPYESQESSFPSLLQVVLYRTPGKLLLHLVVELDCQSEWNGMPDEGGACVGVASWRRCQENYLRSFSLTPTKDFVYGSSMKISQNNLPKPTEGELELLRVLWVKGSATVRELHDAVSQERPLGYTTVLKLLQIMTEKGLVQRRELGRAHVYRATASQEETQSQLLRDLSERLFSGSATQLAMHALTMQPATSDELKEIRKLIDRKQEKR